MKKIFMLLLLILVISLTGCTNFASVETPPPTPGTPDLGVYAYINTSVTTYCENANEWYDIGGFVITYLEGFYIDVVNPAIVYNATINQTIESTLFATIYSDKNGVTSHTKIVINNQENFIHKGQSTYMKFAGDKYPVGLNRVLDIEQGDRIHIKVLCDTADTYITFDHLTGTLKRFGR
jgi:hypothetical protein